MGPRTGSVAISKHSSSIYRAIIAYVHVCFMSPDDVCHHRTFILIPAELSTA